MAEDILKKIEFEEEGDWDYKRIFLALFLVIFIGIAGFTIQHNYFNENSSSQDYKTRYSQVQGASTEEKMQNINYSTDAISESLQKNLNALTQEANNLNAAEIATSSPQVQKILKDLQGLEDYPKNQVKAACMRVCNSL